MPTPDCPQKRFLLPANDFKSLRIDLESLIVVGKMLYPIFLYKLTQGLYTDLSAKSILFKIIKILRWLLSQDTKNLSSVLLLKSGSAALVTIKTLSIFAAIICSSLSPR